METTKRNIPQLNYLNTFIGRFIKFISRHTRVILVSTSETLMSTSETSQIEITNVNIITPQTIYLLQYYNHKIYFYKLPVSEFRWHIYNKIPRLYIKHDKEIPTKVITL